MKGKNYTRDEWIAEGLRLFGGDFDGKGVLRWRFKCPQCGNIATGQDFKDAGATPDDMPKKCIGRFVKGKGCDWCSYGLLDICTVHVDGQPVFEFAPYKEVITMAIKWLTPTTKEKAAIEHERMSDPFFASIFNLSKDLKNEKYSKKRRRADR